jgi:hypothetical protein
MAGRGDSNSRPSGSQEELALYREQCQQVAANEISAFSDFFSASFGRCRTPFTDK